MTLRIPSDDTFASDQASDHIDVDSPRSDAESTYSDLVNTLSQLGMSAAYHDVTKHEIDLLKLPDMRFLDSPSHTSIFGKTGSGKSVLISSILQDELLGKSQQLKD